MTAAALGILAGIAFALIGVNAKVLVDLGRRLDRMESRLTEIEVRLARIEQRLDDHLSLPQEHAHHGDERWLTPATSGESAGRKSL